MKWIYHIAFWMVVTFILTMIFGNSWKSYLESFYFVSLLLPIVAGTSYFFNYYLVPQFLLRGKYVYFGLYLLYTLIVSLYLEMIVLTFSFVYLANFNIGNMGSYASDALVLGIVLYLVVFASSFILMVVQLYSNQREIRKLREEQDQASKSTITVRADRRNRKISLDDLLYIESRSDYLILTSPGEEIVTREKISHIIRRLPKNFVRIHRSFIVNREKVKSYTYDSLNIGEEELPISRTYRTSARALLS